MSRMKEIVGLGIVSGALTVGSGLGLIAAAETRADEIQHCDNLETEVQQSCIEAADDISAAGVVAGFAGFIGLVGAASCERLLFKGAASQNRNNGIK